MSGWEWYSAGATAFIICTIKQEALPALCRLLTRPCASTPTLSSKIIHIVSDVLLSQIICWTAAYVLLSNHLETAQLVLSLAAGRWSYLVYASLFVDVQLWLAIHSSILVVTCVTAYFISPIPILSLVLLVLSCEASVLPYELEPLIDAVSHHRRCVVNGICLLLSLLIRLLFPAFVLPLLILQYHTLSQLNTATYLALFTCTLTYYAALNIFLTVTLFYRFRESWYRWRLHLNIQSNLNQKPTLLV